MSKPEGIKLNFLALWLPTVLAFASNENFQAQVGTKIDSLLALPEMASANVGVAVYSLSAQEFLYERNSRKLFVPASNMKLVTTAAGLHYLREDFRFKTEFYCTGRIREGRLEGDLIIKGGGDPTISNRFGGTVTGILEEWADSLKAYGIKSVKGKIVADDSYFDTLAWGPGWSWDDLSYWYGAEVSALNFNDNCLNLYFKPGEEVGEAIQIRFEPETDYIRWQNLASTGPAGSDNTVDFFRPVLENQIVFFGSQPLNLRDWVEEYVTVHKPSQFCTYVFQEVLKENGITVKQEKIKIGQSSSTLLFTWHSHPLSEITSVINKRSQNLYAECLSKTLGKEKIGEGSFAAGAKALREYLGQAGIPEDQFRIFDGSGLSYMNLLSPYAIARLLSYVYSQTYFDSFLESLAIPGQDKSVISRMNGVPAKEKMRLKTGFINNAVCLSGYLTARNGELYIVSLLFNNYSAGKQRLWEIQDKICELIANYFEN